jgi:hypothetical protein
VEDRIKRMRRNVGLHVRRQAVAYVALAVALGGSAYAGGKAGSDRVGGRDLKPFVTRGGNLVTVPPGEEADSFARCKRGERAIAPGVAGGTAGAAVNGFTAQGRTSKKGFRPTGFRIGTTNRTDEPQTLQADVLCLKP